VALLKDLGFDAAFNHRGAPIQTALAEHCPGGIDVYFGAWMVGVCGFVGVGWGVWAWFGLVCGSVVCGGVAS